MGGIKGRGMIRMLGIIFNCARELIRDVKQDMALYSEQSHFAEELKRKGIIKVIYMWPSKRKG